MRPTLPSLVLSLLCLFASPGCGGSADEAAEPPPPVDETSSGGSMATEPEGASSIDDEPATAAPAEPTASASGDGQAPGEDTPATYACRLADDFNQCIVERLEGHADTEAKLIQLIQSYRLVGRADDARRHMEEFIEDYPDSPQTQAYRDYLGGY